MTTDSEQPVTVESLAAELSVLRTRVQELETELAERPPAPQPESRQLDPMTRRALFGLAGASLAGLTVAGTATPAAAADGDPLTLGQENTAESTTSLTRASIAFPLLALSGMANGGPLLDLDITNSGTALHATSSENGVTIHAMSETGHAIVAESGGFTAVFGDGDQIGVLGEGGEIGVAGFAGGSGDPASGTIGVRAVGDARAMDATCPNGVSVELITATGSHLLFTREGVLEGAPTSSATIGELVLDSNGDLFLCTESGDPGVWTRLNHQAATLFEEPQRAYDSRPGFDPSDGTKGPLARDETRSIDLTTNTDVPADATSVLLNVAVTATESQGYLSVYDATRPTQTPPPFSTLNWPSSGFTVANEATVRISNGQIKVYASRPTHLVLDITGYTV